MMSVDEFLRLCLNRKLLNVIVCDTNFVLYPEIYNGDWSEIPYDIKSMSLVNFKVEIIDYKQCLILYAI